MQRFIDFNTEEKNEILFATSKLTKISPLLIEKDFWVSWMLDRIFSMSMCSHFIFKGGTSLSKCYHLIQRFSEDIDLTIDKNIFHNEQMPSDISSKKFQKRLDDTEKKVILFIENQFVPELTQIINNNLPPQNLWTISLDEENVKNIRFYYPSSLQLDGSSYIKPSILIEIGVKGDVFPCEDRYIKSYVEEAFSNILTSEHKPIKTLLPSRTFWEKITLLHAENHRPVNKISGDRLSRHYYDVYKMIELGISDKALKDIGLLQDVIINKTRYFRSSWAEYHKAAPGTLKIVPKDDLLPFLRSDYKNMQSMIFGNIPDFEEIIQTLQNFEDNFNQSEYS